MREWFFREKSYKSILSRLIEESGSRGMVSKIADAIGCQRSYLSQVLHSKVQLTKDQAWNLCHFFAFSQEEARYFEALVDFDRAASASYRKHLQQELEKIRIDASKIAKQFTQSTEFKDSEVYQYCYTWVPCALHALSSIPAFQEPEKMATRLGLSRGKVNKILNLLKNQGQVEQKKGKFEFSGESRFIPKDSPYVTLHHQNWRQLAVEDAQDTKSQDLHYTMVQTMSREDFEKIRAMILDFISKTKKIADPSNPEILTAFTLDFFEPRKNED